MNDESKTSIFASVDSLADLGALLRQDFQSLLKAAFSGWFDEQPLSRADSPDLSALELEIHDLWRIDSDLLVLEAWLTSGFPSTTQVEPFAREENVLLTDDKKAPSLWPPVSARSLRTYSETTLTESGFLVERGPTALPGGNHPTPVRPFATIRKEAVTKQGSNPEATGPFALYADSTFEDAASDREEAGTDQQQTPKPYVSPVIRTLKDLASRLRTSSIDEQALSVESTAEHSVVAGSEFMATMARDANNTGRAAEDFLQAGDNAPPASQTVVSRRTNNFVTATDEVSGTPDPDRQKSPAEPIVLGTPPTIESLTRLGVMTGPTLPEVQHPSENFAEALSPSFTEEDRHDSPSLSPGSARGNFSLRQLHNSPVSPSAKGGNTVFPSGQEVRLRQTPLTTRSPALQTSITDRAHRDASYSRSLATAQRALTAPNPLELSESLGLAGKSSQLEKLSIEEVDAILESLEREIEHEYRRYYGN